jgi:hypothetical protein
MGGGAEKQMSRYIETFLFEASVFNHLGLIQGLSTESKSIYLDVIHLAERLERLSMPKS